MLVRALSEAVDIPFYPLTADNVLFEDEENRLERLKDVFDLAEQHKPSVIFIDELDSFLEIEGPYTSNKMMNQLLTLMDGFYQNDRLLVIATTSTYVDVIPRSLIRAGRFDRLIGLQMPDLETRIETLRTYTENLNLSKDISFHRLASSLKDRTVPEIKNIVNEVIITAVKDEVETVTEARFFEAIEKIELGLKNDSTEDSKRRRIAIHEAGHALMDYMLDLNLSLVRISIVKSGYAEGNILRGSDENSNNKTRSELTSEIKVALSGLSAEDVILGEHSTGSYQDLKRASTIATNMVKMFGMSNIGVRVFRNLSSNDFFSTELSEAHQKQVDNAIQSILHNSYNECIEFAKKNRSLIEKVADALLERKVIFREELKDIVDKHQAEIGNV